MEVGRIFQVRQISQDTGSRQSAPDDVINVVVTYYSAGASLAGKRVSTVAPHRQVCDSQSMQPSLKPTATLIASLSRCRPQAAIGRTCNQSPLWSDDAARSRAL